MAQEKITQHLLKAIEQLRRDVRAVELWADALHGFTQPIPEYRPLRNYLLPTGDSAFAPVRRSSGKEA